MHKKMKTGKAAGCDGITTEHSLHSRPVVVIYISRLFQVVFKWKYVPGDFRYGFIITLVKDPESDDCKGVT